MVPFKSFRKAATAYNLSKSSLSYRKNGRLSRQSAHEEEPVFTPAAERAVVKCILKRDGFVFPPRLDHLIVTAARDPARELSPPPPFSHVNFTNIGPIRTLIRRQVRYIVLY